MTKLSNFTHRQDDTTLKIHKAIMLNRKSQILFIVMGGKLPGQYDLPGGIVEKYDASMMEALEREIMEELGENVVYEVVWEEITHLRSHRPKSLDKNQTPVIMTASICDYDVASEIILPCDYHDRVVWLNFEEVLQNKQIPSGIERLVSNAIRKFLRRRLS